MASTIRNGTRSSSAPGAAEKMLAETPALVVMSGAIAPTSRCPSTQPASPPPTASSTASMSTTTSTCDRRAPSARMIATSRLRSSDEPTMLTRIPIAETITTSVVTRSSSNSSGRTKRSSSSRISAIGRAACPSRPSLIAVRRPIAISSGGNPGKEAVSSNSAVTSRCANGSGTCAWFPCSREPSASSPLSAFRCPFASSPSTGFACPS